MSVLAHCSDSPPLQINRSLSCMRIMSLGVGSYECTSEPGLMSSVSSALSPAISRAKSYAGKLVQTI